MLGFRNWALENCAHWQGDGNFNFCVVGYRRHAGAATGCHAILVSQSVLFCFPCQAVRAAQLRFLELNPCGGGHRANSDVEKLRMRQLPADSNLGQGGLLKFDGLAD